MTESSSLTFTPGDLVNVRGRDWVVLPETRELHLKLRPLGGADEDTTLIYLPLEPEAPSPSTFDLPNPDAPGSTDAALLLRDALRLKLRAGAGPFRSFGNLNVEPRAYQLVPLLMALRHEPIRLLIADDVGIGKTIEAGLIARELLDRGEIKRLTVICPPHLCEQWRDELAEKFRIDAEIVRTGTASRIERDLRPDESLFEVHPFTVVSLDYIKSDRRRNDFMRACPEFVIVDEAHACVQATTNTRHQRFQLIQGLAESEPNRNILFLTATPHSGDDTAFSNLLGLLSPKFKKLTELPSGSERNRLREELSLHFVQRRRGDIKEWQEGESFPIRESREATYQLTGDWGRLFDDVLSYARTMVRRVEDGTKLQQRMCWWAALALLRCVSSSPAAASLALRTRLQVAEGNSEQTQITNLDRIAAESVMDGVDDDSLSVVESVPAGTVEGVEDVNALKQLINRAEDLRGIRNDPKLSMLVEEVRKLVNDGFSPVVFCRYIATAHYVGEQLRDSLSGANVHVIAVTGELNPTQREEQIEALEALEDNVIPVLVATDCLSEGVNLQRFFNAVIHYDLTWNPTRHEQREGRADRFGQGSKIVRTLMLYGENNPVDGAVLRVIIHKAERIKRELGVSVPLPTDNNKVVDAIMQVVLLQNGPHAQSVQTEFDFGDTEAEVDDAWETTKNKMTRTVFAQQRLKPEDVLPEWRKANSVLGGANDVFRFVSTSANKLGAPLDEREGYCRLPIAHLPNPLQDRLEAAGFSEVAKLAFTQPTPKGAVHIHRAHPLVAELADYVAEQALDVRNTDIAARCGAMYVRDVSTRTVIYLLRLRCQIHAETRGSNGTFNLSKSLLAEECLVVTANGSDSIEVSTDEEALSLLLLEPSRNMPQGQKSHQIRQVLNGLPNLEDAFEDIAKDRAENLLSDHLSVRDASGIRGLRYSVVPVLPVDTIGIYVFLPQVDL